MRVSMFDAGRDVGHLTGFTGEKAKSSFLWIWEDFVQIFPTFSSWAPFKLVMFFLWEKTLN